MILQQKNQTGNETHTDNNLNDMNQSKSSNLYSHHSVNDIYENNASPLEPLSRIEKDKSTKLTNNTKLKAE